MDFFRRKPKPPGGMCTQNPLLTESRRMKFPYTFTAKLVQFPYMHYFRHNWIYRYYIYGCILSMPVFMYISGLANSPENIAKWKEIRRKEEEELRTKFD